MSAAVAKRAAATRGARGGIEGGFGGVPGGHNARHSPTKTLYSEAGRKSSSPPAVKSSSSYTSSDSNLSSLESDDEGEYMVKGKCEEDGGKVKDETVLKVTGDAKVKDETILKVTGDARVKFKDDAKVKVVEAKEEEEDGGVSSDRTSSEYD